MQSQDTDQVERAGLNKDAFDETNARTGEDYSLNHKAKELVAKSREAYHTASTLAESVEAIMKTRQTIESTDLSRYKADVDALIAWAGEDKPAFVRMLKTLGDELPPKMAAALERLHLDAPDSQPLHESEQKIQSLEADVHASKEEVESVRRLAEAEVQKNKLLQEELSIANIITDDLEQRLVMQGAESARQAEELVQVKETSREHEEQVAELRDEIGELHDLQETSRLEAIEASKELDRIIRDKDKDEDKETLTSDRDRLQKVLNGADQMIAYLDGRIKHEVQLAQHEIKRLKNQNAELEKTLTDERERFKNVLNASD